MQRVVRGGASPSVSVRQRSRLGPAGASAGELRIERPVPGEASARPKLSVAGSWTAAPGDSAAQSVAILLDDRAVAVVRCRAGRWAAEIPIGALVEGTHRIAARVEGAPKSTAIPVEFIVDRTPPVVVSALPSEGMVLEAQALESVLVLGSDAHSGLDLERSHAELDGRKLGAPTLHAKGLSFPLARRPAAGARRLTAELVDRAGNRTKYATQFEILHVPAEVAAQRKAEQERRLKTVKTRLKEDREFQKKVLRDPRAALIGEGLPYLQAFDGMVVPPLSDEHAEFFLARDCAEARRRLAPLKERIGKALQARDPAKLRRAFRIKAAREGTAPDRLDGESVRASISKMLQDPQGSLRDLGVTVRASEARYLPPPFAPEHAAALADWIANVAEGAPSSDATTLRSAARASRPAPVLKPAPKPAVKPAARSAKTTGKTTAIATSGKAARSAPTARLTAMAAESVACDLVTGISLDVLSQTYARTTAPAFPASLLALGVPLGLPAPHDTVTLDITLQQPGPLEEDAGQPNQLAATSPSHTTVHGSDGSTADFDVTVRLHYALRVTGSVLYLDPAGFDVEVTDVGTPVPGLKDAVASAVRAEITGSFPSSAIALCSAGASLAIPCAQVAVEFEYLFVANDQDPLGSGELYFEVEAGGQRILLGQLDADSGTYVNLYRTIQLRPGQADFSVSVRGYDRDAGQFPDPDDYLGEASAVHLASEAWSPGRHTLTATFEVVQQHILYTIIGWVTDVVCWFVEAIEWVVNECGEIFGFEVHWTQACREIQTAVMGFVTQVFSTRELSYVLDYRVSLVAPPVASATIRDVVAGNGMVYVRSDHALEGIPDCAKKTVSQDFTTPGGMGLALSENLVAKLARAFVRSADTPRNCSTPLDSLERYASIDLGLPEVSLQSYGSPPHYEVRMLSSLSGSAGENRLGVHLPQALPTYAAARAGLLYENGSLSAHVSGVEAGGNGYPWPGDMGRLTGIVSSWFDPFGSFFAPRFQAADASYKLALTGAPQCTASEIVVRASLALESLAPGPIFPKSGPGSRFDGLSTLLFVGNRSKHSLELHRKDCRYVSRIYDRNLRLVFGSAAQIDSLYGRGIVPSEVFDGLASEGYDGCFYCLRRKHWK